MTTTLIVFVKSTSGKPLGVFPLLGYHDDTSESPAIMLKSIDDEGKEDHVTQQWFRAAELCAPEDYADLLAKIVPDYEETDAKGNKTCGLVVSESQWV